MLFQVCHDILAEVLTISLPPPQAKQYALSSRIVRALYSLGGVVHSSYFLSPNASVPVPLLVKNSEKSSYAPSTKDLLKSYPKHIQSHTEGYLS